MAVLLAGPRSTPAHHWTVAALPASDAAQLETMNAILDLFGRPGLLCSSRYYETRCVRSGGTVEFVDVPASSVAGALAGLQSRLLPRIRQTPPVGIIFVARYWRAAFDVEAAVSDALEAATAAEIHSDICPEWRSGLSEGLSVLLIGPSVDARLEKAWKRALLS